MPYNTFIDYGTSIEDVIIRMTNSTRTVATLSSTSDVDNFLSTYNHANNYTDSEGHSLPIGGIIRINDGTYNVDWLIAGFDCEKSRVASDGTLYDNGYGIALVPRTYVGSSSVWNYSGTGLNGAYYSSYIRNTTLPPITTNLQTILGSHLINRNVLLSNSIDSNYYSKNYVWTTDYATLMSTMQLGGTSSDSTNISFLSKYDLGEANYKLDLFSDNESRKIGNSYWTRGVCGGSGNILFAWNVDNNGSFSGNNIGNMFIMRPLIYIR